MRPHKEYEISMCLPIEVHFAFFSIQKGFDLLEISGLGGLPWKRGCRCCRSHLDKRCDLFEVDQQQPSKDKRGWISSRSCVEVAHGFIRRNPGRTQRVPPILTGRMPFHRPRRGRTPSPRGRGNRPSRFLSLSQPVKNAPLGPTQPPAPRRRIEGRGWARALY